MVDFIDKQIEASERLFNMMLQDHKERMKDALVWGDMNASLIQKLAERDREIGALRCRVKELEEILVSKVYQQAKESGE